MQFLYFSSRKPTLRLVHSQSAPAGRQSSISLSPSWTLAYQSLCERKRTANIRCFHSFALSISICGWRLYLPHWELVCFCGCTALSVLMVTTEEWHRRVTPAPFQEINSRPRTICGFLTPFGLLLLITSVKARMFYIPYHCLVESL